LSLKLGTTIAPGFEALVFKASRGIEDIQELTYIRKDGSRFPAIVSVTALRDVHDHNGIIGYLLIGTDNTARKQAEEEQKRLFKEHTVDLEKAKNLREARTIKEITEQPGKCTGALASGSRASAGRMCRPLKAPPVGNHGHHLVLVPPLRSNDHRPPCPDRSTRLS
jgi:hypothetical protein